MKKIIYILLPSLFLIIGAGKAIKDINVSDSDKKIVNNLKKDLEKSKDLAADKEKEIEAPLEATEISLNQTILIQGKADEKIEERVYKLNLSKNKKYLLLIRENASSQADFGPTHEKKVSWDWTQIQGEYFYTISVKLDPDNKYILIDTKPKRRDELPGTSLTAFTIIQMGEALFFKGETYGSEATQTFRRPIIYIE